MRRASALLVAVSLLVTQGSLAAASAMPEAPACPILPNDDVWHSNIQQMPVHPLSDTWLANMGGPARLLHPDFGACPYGDQPQGVARATAPTATHSTHA